MQKLSIKILIPVILLLLCGCKKVLDIEPTDKIKAEDLFADAEGRKSYLANLYYQLPTEDFGYQLQGFNYNGSDVYGSGGLLQAMVTDEAIHSEWGTGIDDNDQHYWDQGFKLIRDINILLENIPQLNVSDEEKDQLLGEAAFLRGFAYYGLVKRYGGVPII
ncbi:MAG: RagB/SusD family nutrient uptake outer membrane protein, partial [Sphingobacteriales bacterium]